MEVHHRPSSGPALTQRKHFSAPGAESKAHACSCLLLLPVPAIWLTDLVTLKIHVGHPHLPGYLDLCQKEPTPGFLTRNHSEILGLGLLTRMLFLFSYFSLGPALF